LGDEEQNMNAFRDSIANGLLARREWLGEEWNL
jgi:hypothetical protein